MNVLALIERYAQGASIRALRTAVGGGLLSATVVGVVNLSAPATMTAAAWIRVSLFLCILGAMWVTRRRAARRLIDLFEDSQKGLRDALAERLRATSLQAVENLGDQLERSVGNLTSLSSTLEAWVSGIQHLTFIACITLLVMTLSFKALVLWAVTLGAMAWWMVPRVLQLGREQESLSQSNGVLGEQMAQLVDGVKQSKLDGEVAKLLLDEIAVAATDGYARQQRIEEIGSRIFIGALTILFLLGMGSAAFAPVESLGFAPVEAARVITLFELACAPLLGLLLAVPQLVRAEMAARSILQVLDRLPPEPATIAAECTEPREFETLGLQRAVFAYPATDQSPGFAVGPIDLSIRRGELVLITGGNGSGKTTLLKMLLGLYPCREPSLHVDARRIGPDALGAWRSRFSAILTEQHLFDRLYGLEHIPSARVHALMTRLGIDQAIGRYADGAFMGLALSTGQRMRLAMAVALLEDRPIYLFDEWTGNQDPEMTRWYYETLLPELLATGKTIIAVSHDERFFARADHLVRLDRGKVTIERLKK